MTEDSDVLLAEAVNSELYVMRHDNPRVVAFYNQNGHKCHKGCWVALIEYDDEEMAKKAIRLDHEIAR